MISRMKPLLYSLVLFFAVLCCLTFYNADIHPFGNPIVASAYSDLNTYNLYITKGDTYQLKIKNAKGKVKWSSDDSSIASVTSKGKIKAKKRGTTFITVVDNNSINFCDVTVETPKISKSTMTLVKGSSKGLTIKGTSRSVKWTSSDKKIAKVSKYGTVTARKAGNAIITGTVGNHAYECNVKVEAPKISKQHIILEPNQKIQLYLNGTTQKVKWSSSNKKAATVSSDGLVSAKSFGYGDINATVNGITFSCDFTVEKPYLSDNKLVLIQDDSHWMNVYDTYQDEKWSSSNSSIATIDSSGDIEAVGSGECLIICDLGYKKLYCNVLVENPVLSKESIILTEGENFQLNLNGTTQTVNWSSSNPSVIDVSKTGMVTAKKTGYGYIYASIGSNRYTCEVQVKDEPVDLNKIDKMYYDTGKGVVGVFVNNYKYPISIEMTVLYYDSKGNLIDKRSNSLSPIAIGSEVAIKVSQPYDSNTWDDLDYSKYQVIIDAEKSYYSSEELGNKDIEIESINTGSKVIATVRNKSQIDYSSIQLCILYFDRNGNCIGYDYEYADCTGPEKTDYITFDYPYDSLNYESITPASFKILLNHAYDW